MDALQQWTRHADSDLYIVEALLGAPLGPLQPLTEALALAVVRRQQPQAVRAAVPSQQTSVPDGGEGGGTGSGGEGGVGGGEGEGGCGLAEVPEEAAGERREEQAVHVAAVQAGHVAAVQAGVLAAGAGAAEVLEAVAAGAAVNRREDNPEEVYELKRPVSAEVRAGGWGGWEEGEGGEGGGI